MVVESMLARNLHGVFSVLKPRGITCQELLTEMKYMLDPLSKTQPRAKHERVKLGHGGTLDSTATGVLAVGIGDGCKLLTALLSGDKRYTCKGRLGVATDTYNERGEVILEIPSEHVSREDIENQLGNFIGNILQKPPKYSALKYRGSRMSDLVRSGQDHPDPPKRTVRVEGISCLDYQHPFFTLDITCGKGFYVRSLVNDLGLALGTCAHVTELDRTQHGPFTKEHALNEREFTVERISEAIEYTKSNLNLFFEKLEQG